VALVVLGVGAPGFLAPQPSGALSLPRLRVPARAGLFCKALTACGFVNFVNLILRSELQEVTPTATPSH
jgi:hypothetical protein